MSGKRPVTVVTGFLGSGKTTLLARVLRDPALANTAVLVNELGEVGLDHHLLERVNETTLLLENGCVCCTRRGELAGALRSLLEREARGKIPPVERVVVETSGLADPSPIPYTVLSDPVLRHHYAPGRVVATVDAVNGPLHLRENPESVAQIAASDLICVTKGDLTDEPAVIDLGRRLEKVNPAARLIPASDLQAADIIETPRNPADATADGAQPALHAGGEEAVRTLSLTFGEPLDWTAFGVWLSALLYAHGERVLRVKGLLDAGGTGPVSINGVQHVIHPPEHLDDWPGAEEPRSRLVFIVRGLEPSEIEASLRAFQALPGATP